LSVALRSYLSPYGGGITIEKDDFNFIENETFPKLMEIFGWTLKEYKTYQNLAIIRADFYPIGYVLGFSKKAIIICDGEMLINYRGNSYSDFEDLVSLFGEEAYETFPDWEIKIEKQWAVKSLDGEWITAFSNLVEMPYRTQVKC